MNGYVAYIVVMAVIIALMMTAIGSINFVLRTARRFYYGDWKYRCKLHQPKIIQRLAWQIQVIL